MFTILGFTVAYFHLPLRVRRYDYPLTYLEFAY